MVNLWIDITKENNMLDKPLLNHTIDIYGETEVEVSFNNGKTWYVYNNKVSEFDKQEMIRISNAGHGGLRRFMHDNNITFGVKYDKKYDK